jgi:predicted ferric reductase
MKPIDLAGDVVTGGSALAGLFLVYLGNAAAAFSAFEKQQQDSVRQAYQLRAWLAFAGIVFGILAAALALLGKWLGNQSLVASAIVLLFLALVWGAVLAVIAARDIR